MADKEKVIKGLEICTGPSHCWEGCPYWSEEPNLCDLDLMKDALALLREQEPVKPVCTEYDNAIVLFSCRECKTQLLYGQRYCHMCGKAVKWDAAD